MNDTIRNFNKQLIPVRHKNWKILAVAGQICVTIFIKIKLFNKLMAYKRLFFFTLLLAICYFVGVTWAETAANKENVSSTINSTVQVAPVAISSNTPTKGLPTFATVVAAAAAQNSTTPKCVCDADVSIKQPKLAASVSDTADKCQHKARNSTLIKVVVIIVIFIISILVIYMLFLMCLDPLLNKRVKANYQEHTNEDDDPTSSSPPLPSMNNQELNARANVLNRVGHQQDKWKRQVREQRRHIYDRRTMLN